MVMKKTSVKALDCNLHDENVSNALYRFYKYKR